MRPEVAEQIESMGAEFVYLDFEESAQDGAATGGYAAVSSPEFASSQLKKFRELAPEVDIVITTALIPGRDAPMLWTKDMVELMKPGSVIVDLAAERGGNCELTVKDEKIVTENGVTIVGYTDFPSRMAAQSSTALCQQHPSHDDRSDAGKDGQVNHNMEDDVIRGATVTKGGEITSRPRRRKSRAIAAQPKKDKPKELTPEEKKAKESAAFKEADQATGHSAGRRWRADASDRCLCACQLHAALCGVRACLLRGLSGDLGRRAFAAHAAYGGHKRHFRHRGRGRAASDRLGQFVVVLLAGISILIASINIFGGFLVTRRMLAMFQKS